MKYYHFFLSLALIACMLSCGKEKDNAAEQSKEIQETEEVDIETILPNTKTFYATMLEDIFCEHYSDIFKGSDYKEGTLSIIKYEFIQEEKEPADSTATESVPQVEVVGSHSYKGTAGYDLSGQKFKAFVKVEGKGYLVRVFRESTQVLSNKSYWEEGSKSVHYEE